MPKETFKGNLGDLVDIVLGGLGNKKRKARFKKKAHCQGYRTGETQPCWPNPETSR